MPIFDGNLPYTNLHELNLDWITKIVKEVKNKTDEIDEAVSLAKQYAEDSLSYAQESENYAQILSSTIITPEMYGAVGDGLADDTQALQSCLRNNRVIVLTKTYRISQPLVFDNLKNVSIFGGTITRTANMLFNTITGTNCEDISFENVTLDGVGNDRNMTYVWESNVQGAVLLHGHCKNIKLNSCKILNFNYGVYILGADVELEPITYENMSYNGTITNCVFYNCNSPIDTYGKSLLIDHNIFYDITGYALQIEPYGTSTDVAEPLLEPVFYGSACSCVLSNNLFVNVQNYCINIFANNTYAVSVTNNTMIDFGSAINVNNITHKGVLIKDNFCYYQKPVVMDSNTRPWHITGTITTVGKVIVENNTIYYAQSGLRLQGYEIVKGNILYKPVTAIVIYTGSGTLNAPIILENNMVYGHVYDSNLWWGMRAIVLGQCNNLIANNNYVESDTQPLVVQNNATGDIKNLYSTVAFTGSVGTISGLNNYSN